jgi:cytochrome b
VKHSDNATAPAPVTRDARVVVWDLPTRIFHVCLVLLVPFSWWTQHSDRMTWHKFSGFLLAALLVFRLFWGFAGTATSRFSNFLHGPRRVWRYVLERNFSTLGHNPLGGWSVFVMLAILSTQVLLGLFSADEDGLESGPLAGLVTFHQARSAARLHGVVFDFLLAAISIHVVAVIVHQALGHNLIGPILSGRAKVAKGTPSPARATRLATITAILLACVIFLALWWLQATQV